MVSIFDSSLYLWFVFLLGCALFLRAELFYCYFFALLIIIVAGSLYMYMSLNGDKVLLSVGSLSGIVVDFIGAVFIKMYLKRQLDYHSDIN